MVSKVTGHIGQLALAGVVALAVAFPSPQDAVDAVKSIVPEKQEVALSVDPEAVLIEPTFASRDIRIEYDPLVSCLQDARGMSQETLVFCADMLYQDLTRPAGTPSAMPFTADARTYEARQRYDENTILAITDICRAIWIANNGDIPTLGTPACERIVSGIDRPIELH